MPVMTRRSRGPAHARRIVIGALLVVTIPAHAAEDKFRITPGPVAMTDEEKAIRPEPARGVEHGVILVEEVDRNDNYGRGTQLAFHLRAKILSNEARELADITIPYDVSVDDLTRWWARAILPDGQVRELPKEELTRQTIVKTRGGEFSVLKGSLPGIVPGAVIDYGYALRTDGFFEPDTLWLQREWPLQRLRYRWVPWSRSRAGFLTRRTEGLDVTPTVKDGKVVVEARDIRAVRDEPMMPPAAESRASVFFYYLPWGENVLEYWETMAKGIELSNDFFLSKDAVTDLLTRAAPPAGEAVTTRLRAVYDWLGTNVENVALRTIEAEEMAARAKDRTEEDTARFVMEKRRGDSFQIAQLFVGAARRLGAEAWIALAADRTENYFNEGLPSLRQIPWPLVAVRAPDGPPDRFEFGSPGSGLPYGQIPWWLTGINCLVFTESGALPVLIPTSEATENVGTTRGTVRFLPDGGGASLVWTTEGSGQFGYSAWRSLRSMKPDERDEELLELCGAGDDLEVHDATAEGLSEKVVSYRIRCAGELLATGLHEEAERFVFAVSGPWFRPAPDLVPGMRRFPVAFEYPAIERTVIEVEAPPGFVPGPPPLATRLGTVYGNYSLMAARTDTGFRVERVLVLPRLNIPPENYTGLVGFFDHVRRGDATSLTFVRSQKTN